jgi:hypothetical protein
MTALYQSGHLIDLILACVALEALALLFLHRFVPGMPSLLGVQRAYVWPALLSGALLMLAVRLAVVDASMGAVMAVLAGAGVLHALDLFLRFHNAK